MSYVPFVLENLWFSIKHLLLVLQMYHGKIAQILRSYSEKNVLTGLVPQIMKKD